MAAGEQLVEQLGGQWRTALDMTGRAHQYVLVPGKVLHELARQLDGVPGHAVDAGDGRVIDTRQQVVQHVAELVKQRDHVVVSQQRHAVLVRWREITDEVAYRQDLFAVQVLANDAFIDPGAVAFAGPREQVCIETAERCSACIAHFVKARVVVPYIDISDLLESQAIQLLCKFEQALFDTINRKILAQRFVGNGVFFLLQFFQPVADVPGFDVGAGKRFKIAEFGHRPGLRLFGELAQESDDFAGIAGHLRRQ